MAAPHVAGACALLLSVNPALTYAQVTAIIMDNVDTNAYLTTYCVSGGRLNLYNALMDERTWDF
jgi:serine protease